MQIEGAEVQATMDFCPRGEKVIFYPTDRKKSQWPYTPHQVTIRDMRPIQRELTLAATELGSRRGNASLKEF